MQCFFLEIVGSLCLTGSALQPREWLGKSRRMKNPEKLAASKKKPNVVRYFIGGREIITRDPQYVEEYRD